MARTREQDKIQLFQLIKNAHPGDLPTFDTPLEMALDSLSKVDAAGRRLIVLTDGDPVLQDTAILDRYEQAGIQIDVVHAEIHAPKYRETPQRMARRTGGKYIQIGRDKLDQAIPRVLAQRTRDCIASLASGQDD
ncbi:vWA domain-containing protein [Roseimaritima sediminicola]|uniref:hypothetical protein n=1 Tax=Roseimaritima sediminicola TaxID=2662066 RepID=UPI0012982453|nr:hypothetical protein [Roseimaritima sediminicola]